MSAARRARFCPDLFSNNVCNAIVDDGKFKFLPDTVYVYKYTINTQTTFDKSKNTASISEFDFKAHVHISDCDGSMFVSIILGVQKPRRGGVGGRHGFPRK